MPHPLPQAEIFVKFPWVLSGMVNTWNLLMHYTLYHSKIFWWLQEISLAQATQYESTDEHGHLMLTSILSDLIMLKK